MRRFLGIIALILVFTAGAGHAYAASTLLNNIVSYWKLDGNSNDAVSTNNGADTAITYSTANGIINQGAGMNGSSSFISVADADSLTPTGSFTLNFWVNVTAYNTAATKYTLWVGKWNETGNNREYAIGQNNDTSNIIFFYAADGSYGTGSASLTAPRPATGGWHMITFVFTSASQIQAYIDGVSQGTAATTDVGLANGTANFEFGNSPAFGGVSNFFDGDIDETGLWSRALTSTEITQLYNNGAGLQYPFTVASIPWVLSSWIHWIY